MKRMLALLAGLVGAVLVAPAQAQSAAAGLATYNTNCLACHGTPPNLRDGAGKGAGNSAVIRNAISRDKGGMGYLSTLTDTELLNIATYLANPAAATTTTPTASTADRILNWAESFYASVLMSREADATYGAYTYRCYATAGLCVGIDASQVYLYELANPGKGIYPIGSVAYYLGLAQSNGF